MQSVQPNFEKVKTLFYQSYTSSSTNLEYIGSLVLLETISSNKLQGGFHKRINEFKKEFNEWLDRLDIRLANMLIDNMKERGITMPTWMKNKNYTIDYNKNNALDLLINN